MKNVTLEQLLALIGAKEVDILLLKEELADARKRIAELEKPEEKSE